jgi:hypothetical protein
MSKLFIKVQDKDIERIDYTVIDDSEYCCDKTLLSQVFDKYEVPEEYRLLFFYKSVVGNAIKEFFTDTPLVFSNKSSNGVSYKMKGKKDTEESHFYHMNNISTCDKEYIKNFFFKMDENNYMDRYLQALNDYFFLKIDLYHINLISDSEDPLNTKRRSTNKAIKESKKARV